MAEPIRKSKMSSSAASGSRLMRILVSVWHIVLGHVVYLEKKLPRPGLISHAFHPWIRKRIRYSAITDGDIRVSLPLWHIQKRDVWLEAKSVIGYCYKGWRLHSGTSRRQEFTWLKKGLFWFQIEYNSFVMNRNLLKNDKKVKHGLWKRKLTKNQYWHWFSLIGKHNLSRALQMFAINVTSQKICGSKKIIKKTEATMLLMLIF